MLVGQPQRFTHILHVLPRDEVGRMQFLGHMFPDGGEKEGYQEGFKEILLKINGYGSVEGM